MLFNKTGKIILMVVAFAMISIVSAGVVMAPPIGCDLYNDSQPECEIIEGCFWQDSCYGSVTCDIFSDGFSCTESGCSWNEGCDDIDCTDQPSCETPFGCGSMWNAYCDDSICSDQPCL